MRNGLLNTFVISVRNERVFVLFNYTFRNVLGQYIDLSQKRLNSRHRVLNGTKTWSVAQIPLLRFPFP